LIFSSSIGRVEDVDGGVDMAEVYDELAELVLGVLDLICNLGPLGTSPKRFDLD
jgi:hypothetical protein